MGKGAGKVVPLGVGEEAPDTFTVTDAETGEAVTLRDLLGWGRPVYVCLLRYSACAMCQLRVHQLQSRMDQFHEAGVSVMPIIVGDVDTVKAGPVALAEEALQFQFESGAFSESYKEEAGDPLKLKIYVAEDLSVHLAYHSKISFNGSHMGCGVCYHLCSAPEEQSMMPALQYVKVSPEHMTSAAMFQMPVDCLVDKEGKIVDIHHGTVMGDHMPWERIEKFLNAGKTPKPATMAK